MDAKQVKEYHTSFMNYWSIFSGMFERHKAQSIGLLKHLEKAVGRDGKKSLLGNDSVRKARMTSPRLGEVGMAEDVIRVV